MDQLADATIPIEKKFFSIDELVAAGFGSRTTIWRKIKHEGMPAIKDGRRILIPRDAFEFWCYERRTDAHPELLG